MIRIDEIVEKVGRNHPQADLDLLRRAYIFSARWHRGQKRASGEPYLVHPLEVANILADMRLDEKSVATGLLHDVVEDTLVESEVIREQFGPEIAHLVDGLTKIAQISNQSREQHLADVLGLLHLLGLVADLRDLGQPLDEVRDLLAEQLAYLLGRGQRVLDHVVQQARRHGDFVEPHVGEDVGDFERVDEVRLSGGARLTLVRAGREEVRAPQHVKVGLRVVAGHFFDNLFDANHKGAVSSQRSAVSFFFG